MKKRNRIRKNKNGKKKRKRLLSFYKNENNLFLIKKNNLFFLKPIFSIHHFKNKNKNKSNLDCSSYNKIYEIFHCKNFRIFKILMLISNLIDHAFFYDQTLVIARKLILLLL